MAREIPPRLVEKPPAVELEDVLLGAEEETVERVLGQAREEQVCDVLPEVDRTGVFQFRAQGQDLAGRDGRAGRKLLVLRCNRPKDLLET